jgi:hypothetical protein
MARHACANPGRSDTVIHRAASLARSVGRRWVPAGSESRAEDGYGWSPLAAERIVTVALVTWFAVISAMRLKVLLDHGDPGFDGRLYIEASRAWLAGGDPWAVQLDGISYAAPPPSLLALAPFAVLPDIAGIALIAALGLGGTWWALRRLRIPAWWLLFPPFVDGLWNANPQVLLLPLLVAGSVGGAAAVIVKVYAAVPLVLLGRARALVLAALALAVTAPVLPWGSYLGRLGEISATLETQSRGGMSATTSLLLVAVAVASLIVIGRRRAAWLAVPGLWPTTQWYYATLAVPGLTPVAAALMAVPAQGIVVAALVAAAIESCLQRWVDESWPAGPPT